MKRLPPIDIDVDAVLSNLRGFQRDAVEHAFHRLYGDPETTRRFLVADEVGLGKTLIARGILARAIAHLDREGVERIDIVYVCSNQRIAKQNLRRLNPTKEKILESAERITLLPLSIDSLEGKRLNFVAFTPGTSFDMQSRLGNRRERLLLHALIENHWHVGGTGPLNLFQATVRDTEGFRSAAREFRRENKISVSLERAFHARLDEEAERQRVLGKPTLADRYRDLCERFRVAREKWPQPDREDRNRLVSELRAQLARSCIASLEPDVVVLDEFQRFKHLLEGDSEAAELAQALFSYTNEKTKVRVLLLSATPYKMYTLAHERAEDDHYADFLRTVSFLDPDRDRGRRFESDLENWRREIFRMASGPSSLLLDLKTSIESHLRRVMSRTERIGVGNDRDGMITEVAGEGLRLDAHDVEGFVHLERIAREVETPGVLDYWKSAPFPLNFMEEYALKRRLLDGLEQRDQGDLPQLLEAFRPWLLDWNTVEAYEPLPIANSRMKALIAEMERCDAFHLLWVPPTLPYWKLSGPFEQARAAGFTKRLVFSGWTVVPKSIATLLSYEAEGHSFRGAETEPKNTPEARKRRTPLLRFAKTDGRLTGMPVIAMLYPSAALAELGDVLRGQGGPAGEELGANEIAARVADRIRPHLARLLERVEKSGPVDEAWYWAAPVLLDRLLALDTTEEFWTQAQLRRAWTEGTVSDEEDEREQDVLFAEHVSLARQMVEGELQLGRPPDDLSEVVALQALAAPGTVALRALSRGVPAKERGSLALRGAAARAAWGFRSLFNRPESMAIVRGSDAGVAYWIRVLQYGLEGCLTSTVDEWVSILSEMLGVSDRSSEDAAHAVAEAMVDALTLRTATHDLHEIVVRGERVEAIDRSLRAHFALRFGSEKTEDEAHVQREGQVQQAFNSPFWPMVLATTSVGQEGLDFHPYCHAVVHWNLPANPVDLEQREGRVNRFKNHAVRKNVVAKHGQEALALAGAEPWTRLFDLAIASTAESRNGLVPHWIFATEAGARIERHVPAFPLSKDVIRLAALRRSLAAYRIVFGQPRQDDLMEWLMTSLPEQALEAAAVLLRIELSPSRA